MTKRRNFSDKFKAAVALEALRGDETVQEIVAKRQLHPTQVNPVAALRDLHTRSHSGDYAAWLPKVPTRNDPERGHD